MSPKILGVLILLAVAFNGCVGQENLKVKRNAGEDANITAILDTMLAGYDKRVRPNYWGDPVTVDISIVINGITSISDDRMELTFVFYFRQFWNDPRLAFPGDFADSINLGNDFGSQIWVPDMFFANEREAKIHEVSTPNEFIRVNSNGDVAKSIRVTVTASCMMNYRNFPMDEQRCGLEIESYGYKADELIMQWKNDLRPVTIDPEVGIANFHIKTVETNRRMSSTSTGTYSRLAFDFILERITRYYITHVYLPAAMVVIISWVTLWLSRNEMGIRILVSVIAQFTLLMFVSNFSATLPKLSYVKAIDVYLGICTTMIFFTIIEHAVVGYIGKKAQDRLKESSSNTAEVGAEGVDRKGEVNVFTKAHSMVDKISRALFPAVFLLFNIIYFSIY